MQDQQIIQVKIFKLKINLFWPFFSSTEGVAYKAVVAGSEAEAV